MPKMTLDSMYMPAFAPKAAAGDEVSVASLDYNTRLGFQTAQCAIDEKADRCGLELTRRHVHAVHEDVRCVRFEVARQAPAAFAGASALVATQLTGCANQTAMLQNQQLAGEMANAAAAAGSNGLNNFQLTAFQLRGLQIAQNSQAQVAGISAASASIGAAFAAYGWGGGYGYGAGYAWGRGYGPGDAAVLPAATAAGGCCGR